METQVKSISGGVKGQASLPESVFGATGPGGVLWESVRCYLANQRQGNACTKTRSEVSGTGKKPHRQKHTGRARVGSRRSPIFRGGGVVFGPRPRDYGYELPKKIRRRALCLALSERQAKGDVTVVEDFDLPAPKTKEMAKVLAGLGLSGSVLLLVGEVSPNLKRASGNIPGLTVAASSRTSPYAVIKHKHVVVTESGLANLVKTLGAA
ncbi:MAG: 50S ribosomal protein L4 [bacterium]